MAKKISNFYMKKKIDMKYLKLFYHFNDISRKFSFLSFPEILGLVAAVNSCLWLNSSLAVNDAKIRLYGL